MQSPSFGNRSIDSLILDAARVTTVASDEAENSFTVRANRGDVTYVEVIPETNTFADLNGSTIDIDVNGVEKYKDVPLHRYSQEWDDLPKVLPLYAKEQSEINFRVNNGSASVYDVVLVFHHGKIPEGKRNC